MNAIEKLRSWSRVVIDAIDNFGSLFKNTWFETIFNLLLYVLVMFMAFGFGKLIRFLWDIMV